MQTLLPLIPAGATPINKNVCVWQSKSEWTYFIGLCPVYYHDVADHDHFRLTIAQLVESGACRQHEIMTTFGITKNKVIRAVRQVRERGVRSFFTKRRTRKGGTKLTIPKLRQAQLLLDGGASRPETAEQSGVKYDTIRKAVNDGRLRETAGQWLHATTLSERSMADAWAAEGMGTACTRPGERVLAALGVISGACMRFEPALDVPNGGVLGALPALIANGLLTGIEKLGPVGGYYTSTQMLLVLAFMCLCRIPTVEQLGGCTPGELGRLLGLDRIPSTRCLRIKMDAMACGTHAEEWAAGLSRQWMEQASHFAGFLYVDGHVKVYSGDIRLPSRYVSRQRLCLRGISNYWVNDAVGRPFFVVEKQIDTGLLQVLRQDIVPRLIDEVPCQPTDEQLAADRCLHRFVIVFDREGYSPAFFKEMWEEHRIACISYRKNCNDAWPEERFREIKAVMPRGETVRMRLAEMGTLLGAGADAVWVKEIRKLTDTGHQTSVITNAYGLDADIIAPCMFTRWCQENFFSYAMHHFPIDILAEYGTEAFSGTERVVNPAWRELRRQRCSANGKLVRRQAAFVKMDSGKAAAAGHGRHAAWETKKAELLENIQELETES
jgi:transposase